MSENRAIFEATVPGRKRHFCGPIVFAQELSLGLIYFLTRGLGSGGGRVIGVHDEWRMSRMECCD